MINRWILALLVAPIASPIIITLQFGGFDWRLVGATLTVAYVALVVCALPLFYLIYRRGWRRWWQFLIAGIVACCVFLLWDLAEAPRRAETLFPYAMRFIIHAAVASLVFWLVAIRPRARHVASATEGM